MVIPTKDDHKSSEALLRGEEPLLTRHRQGVKIPDRSSAGISRTLKRRHNFDRICEKLFEMRTEALTQQVNILEALLVRINVLDRNVRPEDFNLTKSCSSTLTIEFGIVRSRKFENFPGICSSNPIVDISSCRISAKVPENSWRDSEKIGRKERRLKKLQRRVSKFDLQSLTHSLAMSLRVPKANNIQIFKDGIKVQRIVSDLRILLDFFSKKKQQSSGIEDAVLRNIAAVSELSDLVRTSFGPNGASFSGFIR